MQKKFFEILVQTALTVGLFWTILKLTPKSALLSFTILYFKHRTSLENFDLNTLQNSNTNIFLGRLTIVYAYEPVYSVRQVVRNLFLNLEYATTVQWASGLIYCCAEVSMSISTPLKDDCGAKQWFQNWKNPPEIDSLLQFVCCDFTKKFKATFNISFSGGYLLFVFKICQTVAVICMI